MSQSHVVQTQNVVRSICPFLRSTYDNTVSIFPQLQPVEKLGRGKINPPLLDP